MRAFVTPSSAQARPLVLTGSVLSVAVFALGLVARTAMVAQADLRIDQHIAAHDRAGWLTVLAKAASTLATPETIGPAVLAVIVLTLAAMRRRAAAGLIVAVALVALVLLEVAKKVIGEPRPPAALQLMTAGSSGSYPSGHTTMAAVIAIALVIAASPAWRFAVMIAGGLFALAVAVSRVYLGDHYPLDVLGGLGCAAAAALLVAGLRRAGLRRAGRLLGGAAGVLEKSVQIVRGFEGRRTGYQYEQRDRGHQ